MIFFKHTLNFSTNGKTADAILAEYTTSDVDNSGLFVEANF